MSEAETRTFRARSYSSGTPGRAICNSRNHHFIADEYDGDELTAGEYFLTGLTACAVNMLERVAAEENLSLQSLDVQAKGSYERNEEPESYTLFQSVQIRFIFTGVSNEQAETLVATYQKRCPLYGTVAKATPALSTTIFAVPD